MICLKSNAGFTMVELVVVLAIAGVLLAGAVVSFSGFRANANLTASADFLKTTLEKSRMATLARQDGSGYSVKINPTGFVWFKGQTFNAQDTTNRTFNWPAGVGVESVSLENSGDIVFFDSLTGTTSPGVISLTAQGQSAIAARVFVHRSGAVNLTATSTPAKPTSDTRHLHFNLGWSIQNASQLQFKFLTDPPDIRTLSMAAYFNPDKTSWDYTGSFNVQGQNQTLRIHTHSLDATTTLLSVSRSRRLNTQALEIIIDAKTIVSYAGDGAAALGPFGGELIIP